MNTIKGLSRLGVVLASLGVIAVTFARGASASTAMIPYRRAARAQEVARPELSWSTASRAACPAGRSP